MGPIGLPGAAAGSQQLPPSAESRIKAESAARKAQADQARLGTRDLDDSVETDFSHGQVADRDPDGRLPWQAPGGQPDQQQPESEEAEPAAGSDSQAETGRVLDLDA
jgi:hypothetical protein